VGVGLPPATAYYRLNRHRKRENMVERRSDNVPEHF